MVLVRTDGEASSRNIAGIAAANREGRQVGVENSILRLDDSPLGRLIVQSERLLPSTAYSGNDNAVLELANQHLGLLNSEVLWGNNLGTAIVGPKDLLELAIQSAVNSKAMVKEEVTTMNNSSIKFGNADDLVMLQALCVMQFTGLGDSSSANLAFDLLTRNLKDSIIEMGAGDDQITLNSGYYQDGDPFYSSTSIGTLGLQFNLNKSTQQMLSRESCEPVFWDCSLNASAVGMDNSYIDLGDGNDRLAIYTRIDQNLYQDLGPLATEETTQLNLARIGMINSSISAGSGNDTILITGKIINSTIDLGNGDNQLTLENDMDDNSKIILGSGNNYVQIDSNAGGVIQGGSGDDRFLINSNSRTGVINGGGGDNTIVALPGIGSDRGIAYVQGANSGFMGGIRFRDVSNLELGNGDDVAIVALEGTLTGRLMGGNGLDRLEFTNWQLPVSVDLDLGTASGIGGGINGFEAVVGGVGNDTLVASGGFSSIEGSAGNDVLWLRWSPWLAGDGNALHAAGGSGVDLFVFDGIDLTVPSGWNGSSGIPYLDDLDLSGRNGTTSTSGIGLADQLAWVQNTTNTDGSPLRQLIRVKSSGLDGIGNATLLPIAPLEQLLSGMTDGTKQMAIAYDSSFKTSPELVLLGSNGIGSSQTIAHLPVELLGQSSVI
jgi:Ca2+-binding RTX toxin-like protein